MAVIYPDERIYTFKEALAKAGFSHYTIMSYAAEVKRYINAGNKLDMTEARNYFRNLEEHGTRYSTTKKAAVFSYIGYINGEPVKHKQRRTGKRMYFGCDEDCFNCKYDDCYLPYQKCRSIPYENWVGKENETNRKTENNTDGFIDLL